ncbi:hypothetical protein V8G54_030603 [Vigna mungo]|uniref:Uncharacterized protein n=1 Tax=Vigna mungo TaxID=3915 RepID=A0AAQ3MWT1_VIGMU
MTRRSIIAKASHSSSVAGGESFRLEIGNINSSDHCGAVVGEETRGRSYFVGAFKYLIHEEVAAEVEFEVAFGYAIQRSISGEKHDDALQEFFKKTVMIYLERDSKGEGLCADCVIIICRKKTVAFIEGLASCEDCCVKAWHPMKSAGYMLRIVRRGFRLQNRGFLLQFWFCCEAIFWFWASIWLLAERELGRWADYNLSETQRIRSFIGSCCTWHFCLATDWIWADSNISETVSFDLDATFGGKAHLYARYQRGSNSFERKHTHELGLGSREESEREIHGSSALPA